MGMVNIYMMMVAVMKVNGFKTKSMGKVSIYFLIKDSTMEIGKITICMAMES